MPLLSTMEIAQVCYEQNRAYYEILYELNPRAGTRPDLPPWSEVDKEVKFMLEDVVKSAINDTIELKPQPTMVERITEKLFQRMVNVLKEIE